MYQSQRKRPYDFHSNSHGGGKPWTWIERGLQKPHGVKGIVESQPDAPFAWAGATYTIWPGGYRKFPVVRLEGFKMDQMRAAGSHFRYPLCGFQVRRVKLLSRKVGRMDGMQRKRMGALWHAITEGWFPDWDPDLRYPQAEDYDLFNDYTANDWRWGTGAVPYPSI